MSDDNPYRLPWKVERQGSWWDVSNCDGFRILQTSENPAQKVADAANAVPPGASTLSTAEREELEALRRMRAKLKEHCDSEVRSAGKNIANAEKSKSAALVRLGRVEEIERILSEGGAK